jgi:hypothetical protein
MLNDKSATLTRLALFLERESQMQGINIEPEITRITDKIRFKQLTKDENHENPT